jgi:predicted extracellular nuclease
MKQQRARSCLMIAAAYAALLIISHVAVPADALQGAPSPVTSPITTPLASQSVAAAREISAFARAWAGVSGYSATVTIFDRKGTQSQNVVLDYTFRKPSYVSVHVVAGPNAGVTLTWDGGVTVVARRGSGLAAMFKRTLSLHDSLVTTLRGSSIDQLSFGAILAHGQQEAGSLSEAPGEVVDGVAINAVTLIPAGSESDAGLTREVVELSTVTHLPVQVLGYDGSTLVRKIDFSNVKLQI